MSFILQRVAGRQLSLTEVRKQSLRIGRGTNAELRSENPAVALEHAEIELTPDGYVITDSGSITGTYVNRRPIESAKLNKHDEIDIGDLHIQVQMADPAKPMFLRVIEEQRVTLAEGVYEEETPSAEARPSGGVVRAPRIDYAGAYRLTRPFLTRLSVTALLLIVAFVVIGEVTQEDKRSAFMPGGISSAHSRARDASDQPISNNCASCHDPYNGVTNDRCVTCHRKAAHSELEAKAPLCTDCHAEHRGATKLALIPDAQCVSCHGALAANRKSGEPLGNELARITAFGEQEHPEFEPKRDPNPLRFNHAYHLQSGGVFNGEGKREVLTCASCHKLVEIKGKADPVALEFESHCQRCHKLTFDPRFPSNEIPHGGDPGMVHGYIIASYTGNRDIAGKSPAELRRILSARRITTADDRAVLYAEQVVKVKCSLCHAIARVSGRLAAEVPKIEADWLSAKFTHTEHRNVDCERCHAAARASKSTSDVLMPRRADCTDCHGPQAVRVALGSKRASSSCVTCHEYHGRSRPLLAAMAPAFAGRRAAGPPSTSGGGKGMLGEILLWASVLLLFVILVPVGVVIYQRLRARDVERVAAAKPAPAPKAAPPPLPPTMRTSTMPAPATASAPQPAEPPRKPEKTVSDGTRVIPPPAEGPEPQPTEMVQWFGMLHCTSGVLEGQRFIVDDDGFFIGRDPQLSRVVIADSRISKRHVRIVPRDGKVWAIDQSSTNGTFLGKGGPRVTEVQLKRGDTLVLADDVATFVYQI